MNAALSLT